MVNYLKKTKMYALAKRLGFDVPAMRKCSYSFYRGSEWLRFSEVFIENLKDDDISIFCEIYVCPSYISFERNEYNWETEVTKNISREVICGDVFREMLLSF